MSEYEHSIKIDALPNHVFDFVTDVHNLPMFLPTLHQAEPEPGERVHIHGEAAGHEYDADGRFHVDAIRQRMEWGSDGEHKYSGWLTVEPAGESGSYVTVHLSFEPRPEEAQAFAASTGSADETIQQGLEKSLQALQSLLEGRGKVKTEAA